MGFSWSITHCDGAPVVECHGELEQASSGDLRRVILAAAQAANHSVVIDLRDVSFVSSDPVGMLVGVSGALRSQDGMLATVCTPGHVDRLLRIMGLQEALGLTSTVDEACARLVARPRLSGR